MPEAVAKLAQRVPVTETNFFAIVIEIQSKAGGNLSRSYRQYLSKTVRERKKMKGKIAAMSMEAKASAVIIGLVPLHCHRRSLRGVSGIYRAFLWTTYSRQAHCGRSRCGWMSIGVFMMKKMIAFDF